MDKKNVEAQLVQLKTQLVNEGHTWRLLADTGLMTLRIHCYAPGIAENALHSHTKEDHIFWSRFHRDSSRASRYDAGQLVCDVHDDLFH